ncbi:MAG TPA: PAS domain S-box protein [Chitinophagaceae bacterium]
MKNYPVRITLFYLLIATAWIFVSDWFVDEFVSPAYITVAQNVKGLGFVVATAVVLYFISCYYYRRVHRNELEFRKLFKDNPHPMWVYDTETLRFLVVNDAAVERYKYSAHEFRELDVTAIRPPEEREPLVMFIKRIEDKVYHDSGIWRHQDKYGNTFFVKVASHSTTFGKHKARVVLAMDMDEQIENQRKIQLSEAKLKGLINNSDDLIWMLDPEGVIVTANEAFQEKFRRFLGFTIELSKKIDISHLPDNGLTRNWNNYFKLAFLGKKLRVEEKVQQGDKVEYFEIILNPIYNDNGGIIGVGCFARDITQHKQTENRIKEQVSRLREVAWMQSHELRKPLANILGLLDLVKAQQDEKPLSPELLGYIESSCHELDEVVRKIVEKSSTATESKS